MGKRVAADWSITIDRSPDEVFDYLTDLSRHHEWSSGDFRYENQSDDPLVVGSTWTSYGFQPPKSPDNHNEVRVTELVRPSRFVFVATDDQGDEFINTYVLTPEGSGTRLDRTMDFPKPGGAGGIAFSAILKTAIKPSLQKNLDTFKANVEA